MIMSSVDRRNPILPFEMSIMTRRHCPENIDFKCIHFCAIFYNHTLHSFIASNFQFTTAPKRKEKKTNELVHRVSTHLPFTSRPLRFIPVFQFSLIHLIFCELRVLFFAYRNYFAHIIYTQLIGLVAIEMRKFAQLHWLNGGVVIVSFMKIVLEMHGQMSINRLCVKLFRSVKQWQTKQLAIKMVIIHSSAVQ